MSQTASKFLLTLIAIVPGISHAGCSAASNPTADRLQVDAAAEGESDGASDGNVRRDNNVDGIEGSADALGGSHFGDIDAGGDDGGVEGELLDESPTALSLFEGRDDCIWIAVTMCSPGERIEDFCAKGTVVTELKQCAGMYYVPDPTYRQYALSSCPTAECPVDGQHVVWAAVLCCSS